MNPVSPTLALSDFAADLSYDSLPQNVRDLLFVCALDYLRVASIGERMPWSAWTREYIKKTGASGTASLLYSSHQTDPASAAFQNTIYAGSIDADDTHVGAMLHPGSVVFSAALAMGQDRHLSGKQVLAAVAAGYEAMIRIALCVQPGHFQRGFQSTATCGVFGSATAASMLLFTQPDRPRRIAETLGLAASTSAGLVQFFHSGSTVKRLHAAQAARSGVQSALLAESGFSGPTDILEGQDGFARAYSDHADFSPLFDGLGTTYRLLEVAFKPHACSARVQSAIEAAATLCRQHNLGPADIAAIILGIPSVIQGRLTGTEPDSLQAAQMSSPFSVALAIDKGRHSDAFSLSVDDFEAGLLNPAIKQLSARVQCVLDDEVERTSTGE
ncbi:MAG TPA: MmgE/PrpD family protein, partial [Eoetvoesiella sp.]